MNDKLPDCSWIDCFGEKRNLSEKYIRKHDVVFGKSIWSLLNWCCRKPQSLAKVYRTEQERGFKSKRRQVGNYLICRECGDITPWGTDGTLDQLHLIQGILRQIR